MQLGQRRLRKHHDGYSQSLACPASRWASGWVCSPFRRQARSIRIVQAREESESSARNTWPRSRPASNSPLSNCKEVHLKQDICRQFGFPRDRRLDPLTGFRVRGDGRKQRRQSRRSLERCERWRARHQGQGSATEGRARRGRFREGRGGAPQT